jgi:hypothetical protein
VLRSRKDPALVIERDKDGDIKIASKRKTGK